MPAEDEVTALLSHEAGARYGGGENGQSRSVNRETTANCDDDAEDTWESVGLSSGGAELLVDPTLQEVAGNVAWLPDDEVPLDAKKRILLIRLARALAEAGAPVHRIEHRVEAAAVGLGIGHPRTTMCAFPNMGLMSFSSGAGGGLTADTHVLSWTGGLNCERLAATTALASSLARCARRARQGDSDFMETVVDDALAQLARPPPLRFGLPWQVVASACSSGAISPLFFGGRLADAGVSALLGVLVASICLVADRHPRLLNLSVLLSGWVVGFAARLISSYAEEHVCFNAIALASLVWLLPGLSVSHAVTELATRNIISGTARLFWGIVVSLQIGFGLQVGVRSVFWRDTPLAAGKCDITTSNDQLSPWLNFVWAPVCAFSWMVLMQATPRQFPSMTLSSAIAFCTSYFLAQRLSSSSATAVAAFVVGWAAAIYARVQGQHLSSTVMTLSGVLMLVPGSIGVKGMSSMLSDDDQSFVSGMKFEFQVLVLAMSISAGLFAADVIAGSSSRRAVTIPHIFTVFRHASEKPRRPSIV